MPVYLTANEADLRRDIVGLAKFLSAAEIREGRRNNRGEPFDKWNRKAGVALGSPYCVSMWHAEIPPIFKEHGQEMPYRIGASTTWGIIAGAKKAGLVVPLADAQPGDFVCFRNKLGKYFHTGMIVELAPKIGGVWTVEGNTTLTSRTGEGGGVYTRFRNPAKTPFAVCRIVPFPPPAQVVAEQDARMADFYKPFQRGKA